MELVDLLIGLKKDSFRKNDPRLLLTTTEEAFYNFFVKEDIKIDYLHIDAGHTYEDVKNDFELYSQLLQPHGVISIHDTDSSFEKEHIITADIRDGYHQEYAEGPSKLIKELKEDKDWEVFNFFNNGIQRNKHFYWFNIRTKMQKLNLVTVVGHNTTLFPHMLKHYESM